MKNSARKNTYTDSIPRASTENLALVSNSSNNTMYGPGGMFYGPPRCLSFSCPSSASFNPPLLPLPISEPCRTQSLSHQLVRKADRPAFMKDQSLTPRKSTQSYKKYKPNKRVVPSGPGPNVLPKHVPNVLASYPGNMDSFSDSVFTLSPPPSSLPLPRFSIRPKLSSYAEIGENSDGGATDNLSRILRLR